MLWTILIVLFILWLLGFSFNIAGGLIHLILVLVVILLVVKVIQAIAGR